MGNSEEWVGAERLRFKVSKNARSKETKESKTPTEPKKPATDYSGLEVGMRVQAESEGVWYAAEVLQVATAKKHASAPVKVSFLGYTEDCNEWVGATRLRSKALKLLVDREDEGVKKNDKVKGKKGKKVEKKAEKVEKVAEGDRVKTVAKNDKKTTQAARREEATAVASTKKKPVTRIYSLADQVARFERAKSENNQRYLDISSVYDASVLKGKRVLVVGASKGLGLEIAKALVAAGAKPVITVRKMSAETDALGIQVITDVDVTSSESMRRMAAAVTGPLDFVIYNAGYLPDIVDNLDSLQEVEAIRQIEVCALGPLRCVSALKGAGLLKGAKIAIISSQAGSARWRSTQNKDKGGDYGHHMSRAACNIGGVLMSEELRKEEVPITLLHPGFNRTTMTSKLSHSWDVEGAVESSEGAKRVLHEVGALSMASTGKFINCEDGLVIPW